MDEAEARAICTAKDPSTLTRRECVEADKWIKDYALGQLQVKLRTANQLVREYVMLMARHTFGSAETDQFLQEMGCYPEWFGVDEVR